MAQDPEGVIYSSLLQISFPLFFLFKLLLHHLALSLFFVIALYHHLFWPFLSSFNNSFLPLFCSLKIILPTSSHFSFFLLMISRKCYWRQKKNSLFILQGIFSKPLCLHTSPPVKLYDPQLLWLLLQRKLKVYLLSSPLSPWLTWPCTQGDPCIFSVQWLYFPDWLFHPDFLSSLLLFVFH